MTGKDLIIYILSNGLENEPVYKDGKLLGFLTIEEAAVKLDVGTPTILALIFQGKLDAIFIGLNISSALIASYYIIKMNKYYIYGKRNTLLFIVSAVALLFLVLGYIFRYHVGVSKAVIKEVILPAPKVISETVTPIDTAVEEVIEPEPLPATDEEIDLIALITMAEAEGESELGKRLVIDTILNRVDSGRFPNTIHDVIYAQGQFECTWNGRLSRCYVKDDIRKLVVEELKNRTRSDIHYFRAGYYHGFGKPITSVGNHYFSTY